MSFGELFGGRVALAFSNQLKQRLRKNSKEKTIFPQKFSRKSERIPDMK